MIELACVLAGSALGGMARFWLSGIVARRIGETFPWGTLAVNASGALTIGFFAAAASAVPVLAAHSPLWHLGVVGFLGSYTTVSSFSLQTLLLMMGGDPLRALGNMLLSLGLCLGAAGAGFATGTALV